MEEFPMMTPRCWLQILKPNFNRSHKAYWVNLLSMSILFRDGKNSLSHLIHPILCWFFLTWRSPGMGTNFVLPTPKAYLHFFFFTIYWNYSHINFIFLYIFYYQEHLLSLSHRSLMIVHLLYFYFYVPRTC